MLYGGLGNNLFQIAATISYAFRYRESYCIPTKIHNPHSQDQKVFYSPNINYCDDNSVRPSLIYKEPAFHYTEIPAPISRFTVLDGYFQSERYFAEYRNEILEAFGIPYDFMKNWCSLHVRRGDYLNNPSCHPVVSNIYLREAQMKMMHTGVGKFMVFSDDIEWAKNYMPQFEDADYVFSEGSTEVDLSLASSCEHNIGSNSAFSWWIYYLNQNKDKIGIFPQKHKWFGKALSHLVEDLYMKEWYLI